MKRHHGASLAAAVIASLTGAVAEAQSATVNIAEASSFFDAGAQAYKAGQYLVAAEAFLKANEIAPSPPLLFSAAQAYRRQFLAEPAPDLLRKAITLYRDYLRLDKSAKRREDAMQALGALLPMEARFPSDGAEPAKAVEKQTRLLLSSAAEGAEVSVDGAPFIAAPCVPKVPAGPHKVRVRAPGYQDADLSVIAIANELLPRHVVLEPKPGRLQIRGTHGARVEIDGVFRATLPLAAPILLTPGAHFVTVTMTGHKPFGQVIEAGRDTQVDLTAELGQTRQRVAAWATIGVGLGGAVAFGVLGGLTLSRQAEATGLRDKQSTTPLTAKERDSYNAAVGARDDLGRAAAATGVVSALFVVTGLGLFAFDRPEIVPPNDERLRAPVKAPKVELEVGLMRIGVKGAF